MRLHINVFSCGEWSAFGGNRAKAGNSKLTYTEIARLGYKSSSWFQF